MAAVNSWLTAYNDSQAEAATDAFCNGTAYGSDPAVGINSWECYKRTGAGGGSPSGMLSSIKNLLSGDLKEALERLNGEGRGDPIYESETYPFGDIIGYENEIIDPVTGEPTGNYTGGGYWDTVLNRLEDFNDSEGDAENALGVEDDVSPTMAAMMLVGEYNMITEQGVFVSYKRLTDFIAKQPSVLISNGGVVTIKRTRAVEFDSKEAAQRYLQLLQLDKSRQGLLSATIKCQGEDSGCAVYATETLAMAQFAKERADLTAAELFGEEGTGFMWAFDYQGSGTEVTPNALFASGNGVENIYDPNTGELIETKHYRTDTYIDEQNESKKVLATISEKLNVITAYMNFLNENGTVVAFGIGEGVGAKRWEAYEAFLSRADDSYDISNLYDRKTGKYSSFTATIYLALQKQRQDGVDTGLYAQNTLQRSVRVDKLGNFYANFTQQTTSYFKVNELDAMTFSNWKMKQGEDGYWTIESVKVSGLLESYYQDGDAFISQAEFNKLSVEDQKRIVDAQKKSVYGQIRYSDNSLNGQRAGMTLSILDSNGSYSLLKNALMAHLRATGQLIYGEAFADIMQGTMQIEDVSKIASEGTQELKEKMAQYLYGNRDRIENFEKRLNDLAAASYGVVVMNDQFGAMLSQDNITGTDIERLKQTEDGQMMVVDFVDLNSRSSMRTIFGGIDGPISVSLFDLNDKGEAAFRAGIDLDTISIANLADELNEIASSNTARADKVQQYGNMIARFETLRGATFQVDNEKFQLLDFNVRGSDIAIYGQAVDKAGKLLTDANGNAIMGILGFAYNSTGKLVDTYGTVNGQAVGGADWAGTTVSVSSINDERYKQIVETTIVSGSALINTDENGDYSVLEAGGKIVTEIYTGSRPELQKAGDVTRIEGVVTKYGALDNLLGVVVIDSTGKQHIAESIQAGKDFYQLISSTDLTNEAAQRVINGIKYGFLSEAAVEDAGIKGIRILVKSTDGIDYFINTLKGGLISQVSADGLVHSGDQHAISLLFNELRDNQAWRLHLAEGRVQIGDGLTGLYEKIDKLGLKLDLVLAMDSE